MSLPLLVFVCVCAAGALRAETLSIADLKPGESVVIVDNARSPEGRTGRLYQITRRGPRVWFGAVERETWRGGHKVNTETNRTIGAKYLSDEDILGLDAYLIFLRHEYSGDCPTVHSIQVGYYRDDRKIGEADFEDASCYLSGFHREDGMVVPGTGAPPPDFSSDLFRAIVPPWLIEEEIAEAMAKPAER